MKSRNLLPVIILAILFAAFSTETKHADKVISIDLSKSYPQKKISLQSMAEVEYVALETTKDVLLDERFRLASVSDKYIVGW